MHKIMINNFLDISDLNKSLLENIIYNQVTNTNLIDKNIGCLYEKPSTRTRISFAVGINQLQGNAIDLKLDDLNFSRKESWEDTFKALGCYLDGLVFRTTSHEKLIVGKQYMNKPIINALSDKSHPCQILADLITLYDHFENLDLEISWFGDINNVLFSLVEAVNILGNINLHIFSHSSLIENLDWKLSNNIFLYDKLDKQIISKSHCIMTDVFISMNDDDNEIKKNILSNFQVNSDLMALTSPECVFMHCLPAKIGLEVTEDVINGPKSIVWKQASNRLPAQVRLMKCINW